MLWVSAVVAWRIVNPLKAGGEFRTCISMKGIAPRARFQESPRGEPRRRLSAAFLSEGGRIVLKWRVLECLSAAYSCRVAKISRRVGGKPVKKWVGRRGLVAIACLGLILGG